MPRELKTLIKLNKKQTEEFLKNLASNKDKVCEQTLSAVGNPIGFTTIRTKRTGIALLRA